MNDHTPTIGGLCWCDACQVRRAQASTFFGGQNQRIDQSYKPGERDLDGEESTRRPDNIADRIARWSDRRDNF